MVGVELVVIDAETTERGMANLLRWNGAAYRA
jgi:hypothetical protein